MCLFVALAQRVAACLAFVARAGPRDRRRRQLQRQEQGEADSAELLTGQFADDRWQGND